MTIKSCLSSFTFTAVSKGSGLEIVKVGIQLRHTTNRVILKRLPNCQRTVANINILYKARLLLSCATSRREINHCLTILPIITPAGSFSNGDGITRDGSGLAAKEGVVVVSINYRLNVCINIHRACILEVPRFKLRVCTCHYLLYFTV